MLANVEEMDFFPGSFILFQNFPNPFNPVTIINYKIPTGADVKLKIINLLGEEISVLVDQFQAAGEYSVEFDPDYNLTSGVYLYQLEAGEFRETRKMVYLK